MKVYTISDHHFNHRNILLYQPTRQYNSISEMNEDFIQKWNAIVRKEDVVIHLGDFGRGDNIKEIFNRLNGYKIIVKGNHDYSHDKLREMGFIKTFSKLTIGRYVFTHKPQVNLKENQFNYHGHMHHQNCHRFMPQHLNVCVEQTDGHLVRLHQPEIIEFAKKVQDSVSCNYSSGTCAGS